MTNPDLLLKAYGLMCQVFHMADTYEKNRNLCRYVHSTSRGHEAIQLATAFHLLPQDGVSPYYRDESLLLGLGFSPYQLMLQLLAKKDDPFSGGREYYAHPSYRGSDKPLIIHQSSATGMQAIPSTGLAQGFAYLERIGSPLSRKSAGGVRPLVVCSLGDASITEGEVSEAFQFAVLHRLPVIYLVQDNQWGISATAGETRRMDACEYAAGFPGMDCMRINGSDFLESYEKMEEVFRKVRSGIGPFLVQARVPLLGHHTSGVRREFYRSPDDWEKHLEEDPLPKLKKKLLDDGISHEALTQIYHDAALLVAADFARALEAPDPEPDCVADHIFVPSTVTEERGERNPSGKENIPMVDAALYAIREIMEDFPEAVLYGQDVGARLGGVFRETATLARQFGDHRVFNTAIQEAYIIGSTAGMSAAGAKPIVEVQFADYIYPGINQLVSEISKSCYLTQGKFPVQTLIRVPIGAYGGGGPYHSGSVESTLLTIKGIKVLYPSNAADMKGLMKAAFLDPNPVLMLEHKGLYWSKLPGTEPARCTEPSRDYIIPLGKGRKALEAENNKMQAGISCCIITYGMGVYWALAAAKHFPGQVEIIDLRSLFPLDEDLVYSAVEKHGKCLVLTEEQQTNSFAEALAGRISKNCFARLDAPVQVLGALDLPAVPIHIKLEETMLPGPDSVKKEIEKLLAW